MTVVSIPEGNQNKELSDFTIQVAKTIKGDGPQNPMIAFSEDYGNGSIEGGPSILMFVERDNNGFKVTAFKVTEEGNDLRIETTTGKQNQMNAIESLKTPHQLISIMPRWNSKDNFYAVLLLFKDNGKIRWCYTKGETLDENV